MASASRTVVLALLGVLTPLAALVQGTSGLRGSVVSGTGAGIAGATIIFSAIAVYLDRIRIVGRLGNSPAAMEMYARGVGAPPEYLPTNGSCGVVLIWSK
jgi:hypothetical protein